MRQFDLSQHAALAWMMLLDRWATCTGVAINGYIIILYFIIIGSCTCPEMKALVRRETIQSLSVPMFISEGGGLTVLKAKDAAAVSASQEALKIAASDAKAAKSKARTPIKSPPK